MPVTSLCWERKCVNRDEKRPWKKIVMKQREISEQSQEKLQEEVRGMLSEIQVARATHEERVETCRNMQMETDQNSGEEQTELSQVVLSLSKEVETIRSTLKEQSENDTLNNHAELQEEVHKLATTITTMQASIQQHDTTKNTTGEEAKIQVGDCITTRIKAKDKKEEKTEDINYSQYKKAFTILIYN